MLAMAGVSRQFPANLEHMIYGAAGDAGDREQPAMRQKARRLHGLRPYPLAAARAETRGQKIGIGVAKKPEEFCKIGRVDADIRLDQPIEIVLPGRACRTT